MLSPARDGYATVLELLGSAGRRERAGIFSHNQSVASQIFFTSNPLCLLTDCNIKKNMKNKNMKPAGGVSAGFMICVQLFT